LAKQNKNPTAGLAVGFGKFKRTTQNPTAARHGSAFSSRSRAFKRSFTSLPIADMAILVKLNLFAFDNLDNQFIV
jgi:hypothetical protein